jgi:hypothetical protein
MSQLREIQLRCDSRFIFAAAIALATISASIATVCTARVPAARERPVRTIQTVVRLVPGPPFPAPILRGSVSADVARSALLQEHRCLAEAMYYEARGEGEQGEKAVAEVVFHRMRNGNYANAICAVVEEGAARGQCQFSYVCDGSRSRPKSGAEWQSAQVLAARILTGTESLSNATEGATNYHADYVRPVWASQLVRTAQIGRHIFYRAPEAMRLALRQTIW